MTLSKEALDLIAACETFMAFVQKNGSTQTDRDMAIYYAHALKERLLKADKPLQGQSLRQAA